MISVTLPPKARIYAACGLHQPGMDRPRCLTKLILSGTQIVAYL